MGKYRIKGFGPKTYAVVFGLMILSGLVFIPISIYQWRDAGRSEAQYKIAPLCTDAEQSGCRREIETVFQKTYDTSGRSGTTHYVSLLMPSDSKLDGNIPVWWEKDHSLYGLLKPGDRVTAEEWEGQIVALRGADNSTLRTKYDPTYYREIRADFIRFSPFIMIFLIFIEYKLISHIRKKRA